MSGGKPRGNTFSARRVIRNAGGIDFTYKSSCPLSLCVLCMLCVCVCVCVLGSPGLGSVMACDIAFG